MSNRQNKIMEIFWKIRKCDSGQVTRSCSLQNSGLESLTYRLGYPVLFSIDFDYFTSPFTQSLGFVSIEKIYETLETVFHRPSKHLEFRHKYSAGSNIFNSPLCVWIS